MESRSSVKASGADADRTPSRPQSLSLRSRPSHGVLHTSQRAGSAPGPVSKTPPSRRVASAGGVPSAPFAPSAPSAPAVKPTVTTASSPQAPTAPAVGSVTSAVGEEVAKTELSADPLPAVPPLAPSHWSWLNLKDRLSARKYAHDRPLRLVGPAWRDRETDMRNPAKRNELLAMGSNPGFIAPHWHGEWLWAYRSPGPRPPWPAATVRRPVKSENPVFVVMPVPPGALWWCRCVLLASTSEQGSRAVLAPSLGVITSVRQDQPEYHVNYGQALEHLLEFGRYTESFRKERDAWTQWVKSCLSGEQPAGFVDSLPESVAKASAQDVAAVVHWLYTHFICWWHVRVSVWLERGWATLRQSSPLYEYLETLTRTYVFDRQTLRMARDREPSEQLSVWLDLKAQPGALGFAFQNLLPLAYVEVNEWARRAKALPASMNRT